MSHQAGQVCRVIGLNWNDEARLSSKNLSVILEKSAFRTVCVTDGYVRERKGN